MSLHSARSDAVSKLRAAGIENPAREADLLLRAISGGQLENDEAAFTPDVEAAFAAVVARRARREPLSHISGRRAFWEHEFHVSADVLDPRPETETLVEVALSEPFETVLDLGTGSGCILLSLLAARIDAKGLGVDISHEALAIAMRNRSDLALDARAVLKQSDWFAEVDGTFDLIVSNPPYISADAFEALQPEVRLYEPKHALTPGGDGLACYRVIAQQANRYLTANGRLIVEIGFDQTAAVSAILSEHGWKKIAITQDLSGHSRVISAKRG